MSLGLFGEKNYAMEQSPCRCALPHSVWNNVLYCKSQLGMENFTNRTTVIKTVGLYVFEERSCSKSVRKQVTK